ncbi:MAG: phosphatidate cytidylyltransferase [Burkholderiales bacterium]|nr:phosphatidate cytidylyltransferase [Burkholderiales bacterium]
MSSANGLSAALVAAPAARQGIVPVPAGLPQPVFPEAVAWAFTGCYALLILVTLAIAVGRRLRPGRDFTELRLRVKAFWFILVLATLALGFNRTFSIVCIAFVSFVAFKEYLSMIPTRRADHRVLFWAYLAIPAQYVLAGVGWYGLFIIFIPVFWFLALPMRMVLIGHTQGFLRAVGMLQFGLMTCVFSLSHMAFLLALPDAGNPNGGGVALLFYLVFLTQFNDVAQYVAGKLVGRRRIVPQVHAGKTAEGLVAGVGVTIGFAVALAPWLTPLTLPEAVAAGLLIGFGGFLGDITIAAIKRDLGVTEGDALTPGHGGILGRVDSLTFTAPAFFHFVYFLHY